MNQLGPDRIVHFENHCSGTDPFTTSETTARESWYGVTGYPTVHFDGTGVVVGAGANCATTQATFQSVIDSRINDTEGMSPVAIQSSMSIVGSNANVQATYKLVDPVPLSNLRATLLIYEDDVTWCCGYGGVSLWNTVTRKIYDQNITLVNVNDQAVVSASIPIPAGWNPSKLTAVAYLQRTDTKEIIQGQTVGRGTAFDYSLYFQQKIRSAPDGNGTAVFHASISNVSSADETLTLEPGTAFGDWSTDFLVCGDSNPHSGPTQITLTPDQICDIQVRVHTNAAREVRSGTFKVTSQTTGRMQETTLRVFNGSPSIFFVDNDGGQAQQASMINSLNTDNYLYDLYDAQANGAPTFAKMDGFDIVIWHTGGRVSNSAVLNSTDAANLMSYMDQGGALFVESNYYLNSLQGALPTFLTSYLGCASYTISKDYTQMNGVTGDVIGNGIALPLHFQQQSFAQGDDAVPGATASSDFLAPDGSHAMIRNVMADGSKSVFMPERFDAIMESDPDPNNAKTVIHRVIDWLKPAGTADTQPIDAHLVSGIESARPNPFSQGTQISFALSPNAAGGPVRLEVFDLGGRMVAKIVDGVMAPGVHVQSWNGLNGDGSKAQSGVYFARLTTREGTQGAKLLLLK